MVQNTEILVKFLSAGVIASFVTGIFSILISIKTNKRLEKIEFIKQKYDMDKKKYEQLDAYLNNLLEKSKDFEFHGNLEQTFGCLKQVFNLNMSKFEYIQKEHEKHNYLFETDENVCFKSKKDVIDNYITEYIEKCADSDNIDEVVEYMDKIALAIDEYCGDYYNLIKQKMRIILNAS